MSRHHRCHRCNECLKLDGSALCTADQIRLVTFHGPTQGRYQPRKRPDARAPLPGVFPLAMRENGACHLCRQTLEDARSRPELRLPNLKLQPNRSAAYHTDRVVGMLTKGAVKCLMYKIFRLNQI